MTFQGVGLPPRELKTVSATRSTQSTATGSATDFADADVEAAVHTWNDRAPVRRDAVRPMIKRA